VLDFVASLGGAVPFGGGFGGGVGFTAIHKQIITYLYLRLIKSYHKDIRIIKYISEIEV
jgi:hypothetical protein